jgi:hypothetical protein
MGFGHLTIKWRKLRIKLNYSTQKNSQIICICTKLHKYVIRMAQADGDEYGTVGSFCQNAVNLLAHGIVPLNVDGQVSEFRYFASSNTDDEATSISLQLIDYASSWREACLADVISRGIRRPRFNIDCNDKND